MNTATNHTDSSSDPNLITSPLEILTVLRSIAHKKPLIRMHAQRGQTSAITTLLEIDQDKKTLVFDSAADEAVSQRLLSGRTVTFEASLDRIHVQFSTDEITTCEHAGRPALSVAIPASLVYLQRRDSFRISTPIAEPVLCLIVLPDAANRNPVGLPLEDISGGGMAIFDDEQKLNHTIGTVYKGCIINLPEIGAVNVVIKVTNTQRQELSNDKIRYRIGCAFVQPDGATLNKIQRYVGKLERELIAKKRGF